jgi:hypothetical protein
MFPDLTSLTTLFRLETRRLWLRWPRQRTCRPGASAGEKDVAEIPGLNPHA